MVKRNSGWILTAVGGICLGAGAVGLSQPAAVHPPLAPPPAHAPEDLSIAFREVSQKVLPAVVSITTEAKAREIASIDGDSGAGGVGGPQERMLREFFGNDPRFEQFFQRSPGLSPRMTPRQQGTGSGFIVDSKGIILTNSHVVEGADKVIVKLNDGRELVAESWNFDPRTDIAIVRVKTDTDLPALVLGDSEQMQVGDWVLALGNPFNVGTTVTSGIISATGRGPGINEREQYLQTDAAINPGNSGGPLVNLYGEVVGINTAISSRSGGYDGIGFAIPAKNVRWVADQLIAHGEVKRSYLGVQLQELSSELRQKLNVPYGKGALVADVGEGTPAAKGKIEPGDIILDFNGQVIRDREDLVDAVERATPEKSYDVKVLRDGKEVTLPIKVEAMPSDYTAALRRARANDQPTQESKPSQQVISKLGLEISSIDSQLAEQLGIEKGIKGVVVRNVKGGSPAEEAGLQAGDVIQRVGTQNVSNPDDFSAAVEKADLSTGLLLHIKRGKGSAFVVLKDVK
ncbi:Do family serine endopeptidase [Planctomicrobium sp. SH661]|uniref:Do family serine endopeptidase n=1 Tax=Planctomicrobium sp. SH661 TaxID=3448124 RepID=UPI003F5AE7F8